MDRIAGCATKTRGRVHGAVAMLLALCILMTAIPTALGGSSVGQYPSSVTPNAFVKTYIQLDGVVVFFTGDTYASGTTVSPPTGTVCQLVSDNFYTAAADGREYYSVYYLNKRYNVLKSDVDAFIMDADELTNYITATLWKQSTYSSLKKELDLVGDVRVHGLQYALSLMGYYDAVIDGEYGDKTVAAVKQFQRANGLDVDGRAGPITQAALYAMAGGGSYTGGTSGTGAGTGTATTAGTLTTRVSVNLRKSTSTKSPRLAVVPAKAKLTYSNTSVQSSVTWYRVSYNGLDGWLMGTYVNASGSTGGGSSGGSTTAAIGTVTITKTNTRVRKTANGTKTGTVLSKGSVVDLLSTPTSAAGYTWYNIRTASGLVGFVRGDCATASMGSSGSVTPSTNKTFVRLPGNTDLFTAETKPASGSTRVNAGTVLQMVSDATYTSAGATYCSLYYNNAKYNAVYSDVKSGILSADDLAAYVATLWDGTLSSALKQEFGLVGDVRVYAMQVALSALGYYTGALDGNFGGGSASAVRNFQRKNKLEVDGSCGTQTWAKLTAQAKALSGGGTGGSTGGTGIVTTDFGTVNSVEKASWTAVDGGSVSLFKKGTTAKLMDVGTGKVFTIYRWSGGKHADCVPYTENDTRTLCDVVGFPYNSNHPTNSQLNQIKADADNSNATYTWPDFNNAFGGGRDIGSAWDRRPALLNVDGRVYCVSVYGYPHGFDGQDSFAKSKFPNGSLFYVQNNYYGMMCVHFVGSTTHTGTSPDSQHQANIESAYNYAKRLWPTLVK